jgi:anaerobic magnesium-protoporphyrin IX monomethyl ester cyclase
MQKVASWATMWMPLTLTYIASVLRKNNNVSLIDCQAERLNLNRLKGIIKDFKPEFVISNTGFPTINEDLEVLRICKEVSSSIRTSIFGMYPSLLQEKVFEDFTNIDYLVMGEPEWVYNNLINALQNNDDVNQINGLIHKTKEGSILKNRLQTYEFNPLDDLPFPSRDLIKNEKYKYPLNQKPFTLLSISRGCPYMCSFCNAFQYYGKGFRKRSVQSIIDEIKECVNIHEISTFLFWGESFSLDKEYANEIVDAIIAHKLKIEWSTRTMLDRVEEDLLIKMKEAGCVSLSVGVESFNQEVLNSVNKRIEINKIFESIKAINKSGIISIGHFVFGLPSDNKESIKATIRLSIKSGLDYAQFYCAVPYPNTPFGELAKQNKWIESDDYSKYHLADSIMGNGILASSEIKHLRRIAYLRFYLRPSVFIKTLKRIGSIKSLLLPFIFRKWI